MVCIFCQSETEVYNSRPQTRSNSVWRRRRCKQCGSVFSTKEQIDYSQSIVVRTRSKRLEPLQRDKLFVTIHDSLKHRKTALDDASALTDTILNRVMPMQHNAQLETKQIIEVSLKVLEKFDKVAAVHYRAFHN